MLSESYKNRLIKLAGILNEGVSEDLAISILKKQNSLDKLSELKSIDSSTNNKNLPFISFFYVNGFKDLNTLKKDFEDYKKLSEKNKIKLLQLKKEGIFLGDEKVDYLKFSEKVHSLLNMEKKSETVISGKNDAQPVDAKPIFSKEGIVDIYEGHSQQACIKYGSGYSFCISHPGGTMYQSYRDSKASTFYFVFDRTKDKSDPLHIVVVDMTMYGVELTDSSNKTGNISEYGDETDEYFNYLKSLGVPVDKIFKNKPKSDEEKKEDKLLSKKINNLEWFKNLSYDYKSKYIGRGHELSNEQFDYLLENKVFDLLNQYVNIGISLEDYQLDKIVSIPNLLKSYLRQRKIAIQHTNDLSEKELFLFDDIEKESVIKNLTNSNIVHMLIYNKQQEKDTFYDDFQTLFKTLGRDAINKLNRPDLLELLKDWENSEFIIKLLGINNINKLNLNDIDNLLRHEPKIAELIFNVKKDNLNSELISMLLKYSTNKERMAELLGSENINKISNNDILYLISITDKEQMKNILSKYRKNESNQETALREQIRKLIK